MKGRDSGGLGVGVRAGRGLPPGARVLNTVLTGPSGTGEQQAARRTGSLPPLKTQLLSLIRSHLFLFLFPLLWEVGHRGSCCDLRQRVCCLFSSRSFIASGLRSLIHFEFIFVYGVKKCSSFILLLVDDQFSQHQLLKIFSFLNCIFLPHLSKMRCPLVPGFISRLSICSNNIYFSFCASTILS